MRRFVFGAGFLLCALSLAFGQTTYTPYGITTLAGNAGHNGTVNGTGSAAQFNSPDGVAVDPSGNLYVADSVSKVVRKIVPTVIGGVTEGVVTTFATAYNGTPFGVLGGIAIDASGSNLYVTDYTSGAIYEISVDGGAVSQFFAGGTLSQPCGLALDPAGNVYVADSGHYVIRKISSGGTATVLAGSLDNSGIANGTGSGATFGYPLGVAVDSSGNVYVADASANAIRKVTSAGVVTTYAGTIGTAGTADGTAAAALFHHPTGIAIDGSGNLFVTDSYQMLREISSGGAVTSLAGSTTKSGSSDGVGNNANFSFSLRYPAGLAVSGGTIYVADTANSTIRSGTLSSAVPPTITAQPVSQSVNQGSPVSLSVTVSGTGPFFYEWTSGGGAVPNSSNNDNSAQETTSATTESFTINSAGAGDAGSYQVTIVGAGGNVTSNAASITVNAASTAPSFTTQPVSQTAALGSNVTFTAAASNSPSYQWQFNGQPISGATGASLSLSAVTDASAGSYTVVATNGQGSATSTAAVLTVVDPPAFTAGGEPSSQTVTAGSNVTFTASASNSPSYQWQFNGTNISGATSASLVLDQVSPASAGNYTVVATNIAGSVTSSAAVLTVTSPPPPQFTTEPTSQTAVSGTSVTFTAAASNSPAYQWEFNGQPISGATGASLTLNSVGPSAAGNYAVVATNAGGSVTSATAVLTITAGSGPVAPSFTSQPSSQTATVGSSVTFTAAASGTSPIAYQWTFQGTAISGATSASYTISSVEPSNAGAYAVIASNAGGAATSASANLTVTAVAPPTITLQPAPVQTVSPGAAVTFTAAASGSSPAYQWYFNGTPISGATSPTYAIGSAAIGNSGSYTVVVTNGGGSVTSQGAILAVEASGAPAIEIQPQPQTMATGSTLVLTVTSNGTIGPSPSFPRAASVILYQWYFNGVALSGATSPSLVLSDIGPSQAGSYACLVTNNSGSTLSNPAAIAVTTTNNPGRLINLSLLSFVQGSLSMGFVIGGAGTSGPEPLLIRGVGPSIGPGTAFNVPGVMTDPMIAVTQGSTTVASNSGWGTPSGNATAVEAADAATGAFALTNTASLDSALVSNFPPGNYAATVSGISGDSGFALTEVYDATSNYGPASTRLVNLSCLTQIPTGGELDVGFVIGGATSRTLLIRASGPALTALFGLGNTVTNPQLSVAPLSNSQSILASNDSWGGNPDVTAAAMAVGAFAFPNPESGDSAVLITLAPNVPYAVRATSGGGGTGGTALVEIYEVP